MRCLLPALLPSTFACATMVLATAAAGAQAAEEPCVPSSEGGRHVVCLRLQVEGETVACHADPAVLRISSGDEVSFVADGSASADDVKVQRKGSSPLRFEKGEPGVIRRGGRHHSGRVTGRPGEEWRYSLRFRKGVLKKQVCFEDPRVCIEGGPTCQP